MTLSKTNNDKKKGKEKMEILLAIVVASAVIFFGALISIGNERQRKAIDGLREQVVLLAIQDLRIKHEKLARDVEVNNPLDWLNRIATKVCGLNLNLQVLESFDAPLALLCTAQEENSRVIFTTFSPDQIRRFKKAKQSRLSQCLDQNPLFSIPRHVQVYEISSLNSGMVFDLELPIAWNGLTGQNVDKMERLWMYKIAH